MNRRQILRSFSVAAILVCIVATRALGADKLYMAIEGSGICTTNLDGSGFTVINPVEEVYRLITSTSLQKMWYFEGGRLWSANLDGSNSQLLTTLDGHNFPRALAIDETHSKLFWTSFEKSSSGNGKVRSCNLDGTGLTNVLTLGDPYPYGMALDVVANKMYWLNTASETIGRANLNGTSVQNVLNTSTTATAATIRVDASAQKLYWLAAESGGHLYRANTNGTSFQTLLDINQLGLDSSLALDLANQTLYFSTNFPHQNLYRSNLDGSSSQLLTTLPGSVFDISVVSVANVPEPGSFALLAMGAAGLLIWARRRKR